MLEEDLAGFVGSAQYGMLRIQCACTECFDRIHIDHLCQIGIIPCLDLLHLVGSTESVKEVDERYSALNCGQMCNRTQVHNFLRVGLGKHCKTGLTAGINVGVITVNVQRVGCHGTCGNMEDGRQKLTGNLVHIRDHQKQALGSRVGCGQRTRCQRTVNGTCGTCLGFHFDHLDSVSENVFQSCCRPLVNIVRHRAGRGNRIDSRDLGERITDVRRCLVTIH